MLLPTFFRLIVFTLIELIIRFSILSTKKVAYDIPLEQSCLMSGSVLSLGIV